MACRAVFIVAAKRTPFGTFGGKLKAVTATDMCKVAAVAALEAGRVPPEAVDSVIIGNVAQVICQLLPLALVCLSRERRFRRCSSKLYWIGQLKCNLI